jgi:DNA repair protein RadC
MYKNISVDDEPLLFTHQHQASIENPHRLVLNSETAAEQYIINTHHHLPKQGIHAILLSTQQQLIDTKTILQGTFNLKDLSSKRIINHCIRANATRVILVHTHPTKPLNQNDHRQIEAQNLKQNLLDYSLWLDDFFVLTKTKQHIHLTSLARLGIV